MGDTIGRFGQLYALGDGIGQRSGKRLKPSDSCLYTLYGKLSEEEVVVFVRAGKFLEVLGILLQFCHPCIDCLKATFKVGILLGIECL